MFKWLNKHLIPNKKNHYRPDLLEKQNTRVLVGTLVALELLILLVINVNFIASNSYLASVLPGVLTNLTNEERESVNLNVLASNDLLNIAATLKAEDMAKGGYFAHTSPTGKKPWHWLEQAGYRYEYAGENLAVDFSDSKNVTKAWMNSPTHKANIEKSVYTEIGTGVATGTYNGEQTIFVTQFYASPSKTNSEVKINPEVSVGVPTRGVPVVSITSLDIKINTKAEVLGTTTEELNTEVLQNNVEKEFNKAATSPVRTGNYLLLIVGVLILIVLILTIIIEIKTQHFDLITNGLIIIFLIIGFVVANIYISKNIETGNSTFFEFSSEQR